MQKITYANANGDTLETSRCFPYMLQNLTGIGAPTATNLTQRGFQQDGENFFGSLLEPRIIGFYLWIRGSSRTDLLDKRQDVMKVFNSKLGEGTLTYENENGSWQIAASVVDGPGDNSAALGNPLVQNYRISLYCPDPAWEGVVENGARLIGFKGGFTLPFEMPFKLGSQGDTRVFDYSGTLDAPLRIEFRGPAVMPKIVKGETDETIEVEVELLSGDKLFVETKPYDIDIYTISAAGVRESAFNYVKADSEYFQLTRGENTLSFFAASGDPEAYIYWRDRYVGV